MDEERWYAAALAALDELGPRRLRRLRAHFGSWRAAWRSGPDGWRPAGVGSEQVARWRAICRPDAPAALRSACRRHGLTLLVEGDAAYPPALAALGEDAPVVLFVRGDPNVLAGTAVTVVGTRRATPYGLDAARRIASHVATAGGVVVSGLAFGIDAAAHQGALAAEGITVAVLAGGAERAVPAAHENLYRRILQRGAVLSEYAPGVRPRPGMFPARNRILAALGAATVVVEAPAESGALITAQWAAHLNRPVLAVPAPMGSSTSRGCLELLRDGADCVVEADDPARLVGLAAPERREGPGPSLTHPESVVYALLDVGRPLSVETIIRQSGLPPARAVAALSALELRGLCVRQGGSAWRADAAADGGRCEGQ